MAVTLRPPRRLLVKVGCFPFYIAFEYLLGMLLAVMEDISREPAEYAHGVLAGDIPEVNADAFIKPGDEDEDVREPGGPHVVDTSPGELSQADKKAESRVMGGYKAALHSKFSFFHFSSLVLSFFFLSLFG